MVLSAALVQVVALAAFGEFLMKRLMIGIALAAALPSALLAAPGDMSVAVFVAKADALKAQGPMALFSSDLALLKAEGKAGGDAYRTRLMRERTAGHPSSCPPEGAKINSDELLAFLRSYPANSRPRLTIRQGVADYFIKKYPCRTK